MLACGKAVGADGKGARDGAVDRPDPPARNR